MMPASPAGCHHAWHEYHSFDKSFKHATVQCATCELVIRRESAGNMRRISCPGCGAFVAFAEELAGNHSQADITCKKCGAVAVRTSQCVMGTF